MSLNTTNPHTEVSVASPSQDVSSWKATAKRGTQSGVGVSVSGAGAWAELKGGMTFEIRHLDDSQTYTKLKKECNIGGGVSAFWSWLGISANASTHKEEIHETFNEVKNQQKVTGNANFDLFVTGQYPNVEVDASAYVLVLEIEDNSGNTYTMMSTGDPSGDTGAQDGSGKDLPTSNNSSTITL